MKRLLVILVMVFSVVFAGGNCMAKNDLVPKGSTGQVVYLGFGKFDATINNGNSLTQLANSRIILRNLDRYNPVYITSVETYGPDGINGPSLELIEGEPIVLPPLASTSLGLNEVPRLLEGSGGRQCALVTWESDISVHPLRVTAGFVINQIGLDGGVVTNTHSTVQGIVLE